MRKTSLMLTFLIIFSLIICQGQIYKEVELYKSIDSNMCKIQESGLRLEYSTTKNFEQAIQEINLLIIENFNLDLGSMGVTNNFYNTEINAEGFKLKILVNEENNYNRVQIEFISKTEFMDIENMKKVLDNLLDNTTNNSRYFSYVKGKIESNNELAQYERELINLIGSSKIQRNNTLLINRGVTGSIVLKDGYELNYSIMKYDEDTYLIIGTPVIFTTY